MNSAIEFDIIVANVKTLGPITDYFLGGSTNITDASSEFDFADYLQNSSGKFFVLTLKFVRAEL